MIRDVYCENNIFYGKVNKQTYMDKKYFRILADGIMSNIIYIYINSIIVMFCTWYVFISQPDNIYVTISCTFERGECR